MSYVRRKKIGNNFYYYEQESYRLGGKVRTRHIKYIGKTHEPIGTTGINPISVMPKIKKEIKKEKGQKVVPKKRLSLKKFIKKIVMPKSKDEKEHDRLKRNFNKKETYKSWKEGQEKAGIYEGETKEDYDIAHEEMKNQD